MRKISSKKNIFFFLLAFIMVLAFATNHVWAKNKIYYYKLNNTNSLSQQMTFLMNAHQKLWNEVYNADYLNRLQLRPSHKTFFSDLSFSGENNFENFFRNIETNIQKMGDQVSYGQAMISYTRMLIVDGQYAAVSYSMVSDGTTIQVSKQSNINGELLKASYEYNTSGKLLKVNEFKNNKLIDSNQHIIKI